MTELTREKLKNVLSPFMDTLQAPDLIAYRKSLKTAKKEQDIPNSLRSALRLNQFLYPPHQIVEIILTEYDSLLEERCSLGKLISEEHLNWTKNFINNSLVDYLLNRKENENEITTRFTDVPPIIHQIAFRSRESITKLAKELPEIFAKRSRNSTKLILLAQHPIIILSKFKSEIENWFEAFSGQIIEVHFVAYHLFLADCSLDQLKWHGINVSIICNKFECVKSSDDEQIQWDFSGLDGKTHDSVKADQDQNGLDGEDGENGGKLLIISKTFNGLENLKIISNAGSGGNGQDGGDGKDGLPGKEMSYEKLTKLFPPSLIFSKEGRQFLLKSAIDLTKDSPRENLRMSPEAAAVDLNSDKFPNSEYLEECFVEGTTKKGLKLFYTFRLGFFTKAVLCLVKGTLGSPGNPGGLGGKAGKPGQPGIVQFFNFDNFDEPLNPDTIRKPDIQCKAGEFGRQGADGLYGSLGKPGNDVGYIFFNGKELGNYQGGKFELSTDTQKTGTHSFQSKLLGRKFLRIDSQISCQYDDLLEIGECTKETEEVSGSPGGGNFMGTSSQNITSNAKDIVELYGSSICSDEMETLLGFMNDNKWWAESIIDLSELST